MENANKFALQERLKQPGMRWSRENGQYILALMAKAKSGLWNREVAETLRSQYWIEGAYESFGYPLRRKPKYDLL
jgi:hypothetical protein